MPSSPEGVARAFCAAWNSADADALTALFAGDADFVNVVGFWWHGHRQIRHNHAIGFRDIFPDTEMRAEKVRTRMLDDAHAVVHMRWRLLGQNAPESLGGPDERGAARRGVLSFVLSRGADGSWVAVSAQNTDIIEGAQTHLVDGAGGVTAVRYEPRV